MQPGEGQLHLRFDTGRRTHAEPGRLPDQVSQQFCLADPRFSPYHQDGALTASHVSYELVQDLQLAGPPSSRGGGGMPPPVRRSRDSANATRPFGRTAMADAHQPLRHIVGGRVWYRFCRDGGNHLFFRSRPARRSRSDRPALTCGDVTLTRAQFVDAGRASGCAVRGPRGGGGLDGHHRPAQLDRARGEHVRGLGARRRAAADLRPAPAPGTLRHRGPGRSVAGGGGAAVRGGRMADAGVGAPSSFPRARSRPACRRCGSS